MTDEPANAEPRAVDPLDARWIEPLTELTVDELMASRASSRSAVSRSYNSPPYARAAGARRRSCYLLQGVPGDPGQASCGWRLADLVRKRFRKNGTTTECQIGVDGGAAATIVVTADTPDEARLALLDLDVTADEVRGKLLRWDSSASAWRPADD